MASKSKRRRKVLGASCILAALIIAGSSFAWFTSKDEVTNRLSANADYGVAIAENFTPPENWIPGQTIIKEAGATNTGNVDALVRMYLTGNMQVFKEDTTGKALATPTVTTSDRNDLISNLDNDTTGSKYVLLTALGGTTDSDKAYLRQLGTTATPNASGGDALSEVQAIQAGGWLAYVSSTDCNWVYSTNAVDPGEPGSVTVKATGDSATTNTYAKGTYGVAIDSDTFKPVTEGLYIFRRNIAVTDGTLAEAYEYSGYYFVPDSGVTTDSNPGKGTYYALQTVHTTDTYESDLKLSGVTTDSFESGYSLDKLGSGNVSGVKFFTAKIDNLSNTELLWNYDSANSKFEVTDASTPTVKINIALENLGTDAEQWTAIGATNASTATAGAGEKVKFYYNNDVDSGKTTQNLVKTVQLDSTVTRDAYIAFDFDLNVKLDSVQITKDASGKELTVPVDSATGAWSSSSTTGGAYVATTGTPVTWVGNEISKITWTPTT